MSKLYDLSKLTATYVADTMRGEKEETDVYSKEHIDRAIVKTRADVAALAMLALLQTTMLLRIQYCVYALTALAAIQLIFLWLK